MTNHLEGDGVFLMWLKDRLTCVYKESPDQDFVKRLEKLALRQVAVDNIAVMIEGADKMVRNKQNA